MKEGKIIKKYPAFPFAVVHECLHGFFALTDDFRDDFLKKSSLKVSKDVLEFIYKIGLLRLLCLSMCRVAHSQEGSLLHPQPWNISQTLNWTLTLHCKAPSLILPWHRQL